MEHSSIVDAQRHEAKGASSAASNTVLHANGNGTTTFKFLDYSNIVNTPTIDGYDFVLSSFNAANQQPTAVDTPLQVVFGSAQSTTDVSLASNGTITFNTTGNYIVTFFLRFGRTGGAGTSIILNRILLNGVQGLNTNACSVDNANATIPFSATLGFNISLPGTTLAMQIMRDSSGNNSGGLISTTPVLSSWNVSPSATIIVSKFSGS